MLKSLMLFVVHKTAINFRFSMILQYFELTKYESKNYTKTR